MAFIKKHFKRKPHEVRKQFPLITLYSTSPVGVFSIMNVIVNYSKIWPNPYEGPNQPSCDLFNPNEEIPIATTFMLRPPEKGTCVMVTGIMPVTLETFSIHFNCNNPERDIALRINVRVPQNFIYRNSRLKRLWGEPECASMYPFSLKRGSRFYVHIIITEHYYLIALNGNHFAKYDHRTDYGKVSSIHVFGDVRHVYIHLFHVDRYPHDIQDVSKTTQVVTLIEEPFEFVPSQHSLGNIFPRRFISLPYCVSMPPNPFSGLHLRVDGRVKLLPLSFYLNLQNGEDIWPQPTVAFQILCRYGVGNIVRKNVICQNAWLNGKWGQEEVSKLNKALLPGSTFSMVIVQGLSSYEVFVDRQFVTEFRFRMDPNIVNAVYVMGDVKLWKIGLEEHRPREFQARKTKKSVAEFLKRLSMVH